MIIRCPKCGKVLEVSEDKMGKKVTCEYCGNVFYVVEDLVVYKEPTPSQETNAQIQKTNVQNNQEMPETKTSQQQSTPQKVTEKKVSKKKMRKTTWILLSILVALVLISGLLIPSDLLYVRALLTPSETRETTQLTDGTYKRVTTQLINGTYKIGAGHYLYWEFYLDMGDSLVGYISVPEYDINVWLLQGDREFGAFQRGETFYYLSNVSAERTSHHYIRTEISEGGTYYFILDNRYSVLTPKKVTVHLKVISYQ